MTNPKTVQSEVNPLIIEKLTKYPDSVRELALLAIRLSESYPEVAVADQLQSAVRRLAQLEDGGAK